MPPELIRVRPAPEKRHAFAVWAVAQTPKIRTVSTVEFAVPAAVFIAVPEEVLIGALVDGHRYVSPAEDAATGTPPPGAELTGVATEAAFLSAAADTATNPAECPAAADGGDGGGPDFAPLEDALADEGEVRTLYGCDLCPRDFETERGRDTHRRQAHREG